MPRKYRNSLKKKSIEEYKINEPLDFFYDVGVEDFVQNQRSAYGFIEPSGSFSKDEKFRLYLYSPPEEKERYLIGIDDSGRYCGKAKDFNFCINFLLFQFDQTDTFLTITDIISQKKVQCFGILANSELLFSYYSDSGKIFLFLKNNEKGIYIFCIKCNIAYQHNDFSVKYWDSISNPLYVEQLISENIIEGLELKEPLKNIITTIKYFDKFGEELYRNRKFWEWDESFNKPFRSEPKFYSMDRICRFLL